MWFLVLIAPVSVAAAVMILRKLGGGKFPWLQFYSKGKESGFNIREINLLRKVAVENRMENPTSLFWSIKQLDRSIKGMIIKFRSEGRESQAPSAEFLSKLYDFRRRVEMDLPRYKLGLKSTKKLPAHQVMTITLPGIGSFKSQIVENLKKYLAISYPQGPALPPDFSWRTQRINIYFWRIDDAGYVFESKVIDDFRDQDYSILHITHSDNLIRSQKRRSVRVLMNKPAYLYPLAGMDAVNYEEETSRGLRCRLVDLSEEGAAVLIGGRAKVGLVVKFQFSLDQDNVVMCGIVKGITFNQKSNQSTLHIQALRVPITIRNRILMYVYNIFGEWEIQKTGAPVR